MSGYILYGGPFTRALMVEMVLAEGDLAYGLHKVDIIKGEHRSADFLALNPAGWVPVLITPDGEILSETPAINLHLAEKHGLTHLVPRLDDPERGRFLSGFFYLIDDLEPIMKRYFYPHRFVLRSDDTAAMKERARDQALDRLAIIEQRLDDSGPYHLGERFSLVDLTFGYWAATFDANGALAPYPAVRRCLESVRVRPKLQPKFEEMETLRRDYALMQARGEGVV